MRQSSTRLQRKPSSPTQSSPGISLSGGATLPAGILSQPGTLITVAILCPAHSSSLLGGCLITVVLMLYQTIRDMIFVIGPGNREDINSNIVMEEEPD